MGTDLNIFIFFYNFFLIDPQNHDEMKSTFKNNK